MVDLRIWKQWNFPLQKNGRLKALSQMDLIESSNSEIEIWRYLSFTDSYQVPLLVPFKCWSSFLTNIPKSKALKLNVYQQRRYHTLDMLIISEAFTWNVSWLLLPVLKQQNLGPSICCKRSKCSGSNFNSSWRKGDQNPSTCFGNLVQNLANKCVTIQVIQFLQSPTCSKHLELASVNCKYVGMNKVGHRKLSHLTQPNLPYCLRRPNDFNCTCRQHYSPVPTKMG